MSARAWGEVALWRGRASARGFLPMGAVQLVVGTVLVVAAAASGEGGALGAALVLVAVGAALLWTGSVDVAIGEDGVVTRSAVLRRPTIRVPLDDIVAAEVVEVFPGQWGGWGYRATLRRKGRGWIMRRGPGLQLRLRSGRIFVVTVDDADEAAAVVSALLARRAHARQ